jgi:hypothetical protein
MIEWKDYHSSNLDSKKLQNLTKNLHCAIGMVFSGIVFSEEAICCLPQLQHQFGRENVFVKNSWRMSLNGEISDVE